MRTKKIQIFFLVLTFIPPFSPCQNRVVKDDLGNSFVVTSSPQRIVSLAPNITEILFALDLGERIVGVTRYCDYPADAKEKEKIGGMVDPSVEKIQALNPDLIIGFRGNPLRFLHRLRSLRLPVFVLEMGTTIDSVFRTIATIGVITRQEKQAEDLVLSLKGDYEKIQSALLRVQHKPDVFFVLHGMGLWTGGRDSFLHDLIEKAQAVNIAGKFRRKWLHYSPEYLIHENPDVIIIISRSEEEFLIAKQRIKQTQPFREIKAVKTDRIFYLDENLATRPGPRIIEALERVAKSSIPMFSRELMGDYRKRLRLLFILLPFLLIGIILSLIEGPVETNLKDLWNFAVNHDTTHAAIFVQLRLPRILLAFLVGASLSLSGAMLQGYFQNPMADPFVVGVSSGASLGAVLTIFLGLNLEVIGMSLHSIFAFCSAFALVTFVYFLSQRQGVFRVETLLLTGIAAGALASALTSFLIFLKSDAFEQAVFWLLGSFALSDWTQVLTVLPYFVLSFILAQLLAKDMNLLVLGDETAQSLGCPVSRVRKAFLILSTLLAASSVSVSGIIGFVGLIIPHWIRLLIGPDHRILFPFSALLGGIFLVFSDLLARTLIPSIELPIGIITAVAGAPFFIYLLNQRR